jgi:hypothetical protein
MAQNLAREECAVTPSYVFAGVGGYYASKQSGFAGVFRCATDDTNWKHALSEIEAFTVFVHPHDPNFVFAGTADGVYRSTDRGQNFHRADFPDRGVQIWSFLHDDADSKLMLAGGSPVSIYRSEDGGATWKRLPDPHLPVYAKMPFSCRVIRFARHPCRRGEIFAVLEVSGVMRSTDGGESWSDCSADLLRLAETEPRLRSKLVSDTEAEGMLDGHAVCTSSADSDSIIIAVRMGLFRSRIKTRLGRTCGSTASHRSPAGATSRFRRRIQTRSMLVSASLPHRKTARFTAARTSARPGSASIG